MAPSIPTRGPTLPPRDHCSAPKRRTPPKIPSAIIAPSRWSRAWSTQKRLRELMHPTLLREWSKIEA